MPEYVTKQQESLVAASLVAFLEPHAPTERFSKGVRREDLGRLNVIVNFDLFEDFVYGLPADRGVFPFSDENERVDGRASHLSTALSGEALKISIDPQSSLLSRLLFFNYKTISDKVAPPELEKI